MTGPQTVPQVYRTTSVSESKPHISVSPGEAPPRPYKGPGWPTGCTVQTMNPKAQRIRRVRSMTGPQTIPQVYRTTSVSESKPHISVSPGEAAPRPYEGWGWAAGIID